MKDKLDEFLDSYVVEAVADEELVDNIVARAEADKQYAAANENIHRKWLYRMAVLGLTALAGFWLGQMATGGAGLPLEKSPIQASVQQPDDYLDRIILGPVAFNDVEM